MRNFKELKQSARDNLSGNWLKTIVGILIATLLANILNYFLKAADIFTGGLDYKNLDSFSHSDSYLPLSIIGFIISFLINSTLAYGYANYFLKISRRKKVVLGDFFEGIQNFVLCFKTYFIVSLFFVLWSFIVFLLLIPISILLPMTPSEKIDTFSLLSIVTLVLIVVLIVFLIIITYICSRYALTFYLMVDCEKTKPINYIKQSKDMMSGHAKKYLLLVLSFLGWILFLSIFVVLGSQFFVVGGIVVILLGSLAVSAYVRATFAEFYLDVLEKTKNSPTGFKYVKLLEDNNSLDEYYLDNGLLNKDDIF